MRRTSLVCPNASCRAVFSREIGPEGMKVDCPKCHMTFLVAPQLPESSDPQDANGSASSMAGIQGSDAFARAFETLNAFSNSNAILIPELPELEQAVSDARADEPCATHGPQGHFDDEQQPAELIRSEDKSGQAPQDESVPDLVFEQDEVSLMDRTGFLTREEDPGLNTWDETDLSLAPGPGLDESTSEQTSAPGETQDTTTAFAIPGIQDDLVIAPENQGEEPVHDSSSPIVELNEPVEQAPGLAESPQTGDEGFFPADETELLETEVFDETERDTEPIIVPGSGPGPASDLGDIGEDEDELLLDTREEEAKVDVSRPSPAAPLGGTNAASVSPTSGAVRGTARALPPIPRFADPWPQGALPAEDPLLQLSGIKKEGQHTS